MNTYVDPTCGIPTSHPSVRCVPELGPADLIATAVEFLLVQFYVLYFLLGAFPIVTRCNRSLFKKMR
jgi:hypothetical protein